MDPGGVFGAYYIYSASLSDYAQIAAVQLAAGAAAGAAAKALPPLNGHARRRRTARRTPTSATRTPRPSTPPSPRTPRARRRRRPPRCSPPRRCSRSRMRWRRGAARHRRGSALAPRRTMSAPPRLATRGGDRAGLTSQPTAHNTASDHPSHEPDVPGGHQPASLAPFDSPPAAATRAPRVTTNERGCPRSARRSLRSGPPPSRRRTRALTAGTGVPRRRAGGRAVRRRPRARWWPRPRRRRERRRARPAPLLSRPARTTIARARAQFPDARGKFSTTEPPLRRARECRRAPRCRCRST